LCKSIVYYGKPIKELRTETERHLLYGITMLPSTQRRPVSAPCLNPSRRDSIYM